jgi:hypothetical protein
MYKESLTNSTQPKSTKSKKLGVLALLGVGIAAVATFMGTYESPMVDSAAHAQINALVSHHQYMTSQHGIIGELIEEGIENQIAIAGALAAAG